MDERGYFRRRTAMERATCVAGDETIAALAVTPLQRRGQGRYEGPVHARTRDMPRVYLPDPRSMQAFPDVTARPCQGCGETFRPTTANQLHCRPSCSVKALERRRQRATDLFTEIGDAIEPAVWG